MLDEHVELLERALVEQKLDAFSRRQLAARVLRLDAFLAAAEFCTGAPRLKGFENIFHRLPPMLRGVCKPVLARRFSGYHQWHVARATPLQSDSTASYQTPALSF